MKLLEKLRWLPIETPWPGTADVSANSWVLAVLVGDTPGTSSARSRNCRPFIGSVWISSCDTVTAIWLRAASTIVASPVTVTSASKFPSVSITEMSNAEPTVSVRVRVGAENPCRCTVTSYGPTLRYGKRNRPSWSVTVSDWTCVCVCSATTSAPGTTAPCGSRTRPLTLAEFRVSCANEGAAGGETSRQHTHANTHRMGTPHDDNEKRETGNDVVGRPFQGRLSRARRRTVRRGDEIG